jgi:uncharacterized protein YdaL
MKLGFHGATTMTADLQTDAAATAHAGFQTLELWAAKVDRFLADHSLADLQALLQEHSVAPMTFSHKTQSRPIQRITLRALRLGETHYQRTSTYTRKEGLMT